MVLLWAPTALGKRPMVHRDTLKPRTMQDPSPMVLPLLGKKKKIMGGWQTNSWEEETSLGAEITYQNNKETQETLHRTTCEDGEQKK